MAFGDSDAVQVGQWILAIGNPGFARLHRSSASPSQPGSSSARVDVGSEPAASTTSFTDPRYGQSTSLLDHRGLHPDGRGHQSRATPAAPWSTFEGQVVGINSAIASETGVYQGYGFAIPVNLARRVMEDLVEYGHVRTTEDRRGH